MALAIADRVLAYAPGQENDIWTEYLETCRGSGDNYEDVEPWAWRRLIRKLGALPKAPMAQEKTP